MKTGCCGRIQEITIWMNWFPTIRKGRKKQIVMWEKGVKHYVIVINRMSKIDNWAKTDQGNNA